MIGFFGPLKPFTGAYHPSVYARGGVPRGGEARLGPAFAYKQPQLANGGNVTGNDVLPRYAKQPVNNAGNDPGSSYQAARGGGDYSFGKVSPHFNNFGAEIHAQGNGEVKRRKSGGAESYLSPAQQRAYESRSRFAKGGAAMTQPWRDRPPHIKQRLARGSGAPRIHVEHPGGGLVMSIHFSGVGPHAISLAIAAALTHRAWCNVRRPMLCGHPTPFPVMHAPQIGPQAAPGFGQVIGQAHSAGTVGVES